MSSEEEIWSLLKKCGIIPCDEKVEIDKHENILFTSQSIHIECIQFENGIKALDVNICATRHGDVEVEMYDVTIPDHLGFNANSEIEQLKSDLSSKFYDFWNMN